MSNLDKLLELGAECVGGDVLWKHKVMGRMRSGDLILTEDGMAALEIDDAVEVVKPAAEAPKAAKPAKGKGLKTPAKAEPAPAAVETLDLEPEIEVD